MNNFNVINVTMLTLGGILIYCGIKDISPKEALQEIITGSKANQKVSENETDTSESAFPNPGNGNSKEGGKTGHGGSGGGSGSW